MKNLKKIGAMILVVAMLCVCSVSAFAAEITGTDDNSAIQITGAKIDRSKVAQGILDVLVSYEISAEVANKQLTMLGYVFDTTDAPDKANTTEPTVTGHIRAIDQEAAKTEGTVTFSLAIGDGEDYTVDGTETMVIKLGSDADVTKAQAFYMSLVPETYTITYEAGTYGDGLEPDGDMPDGTAEEEKIFTLAECGFTVPEDYVFDGWLIAGTETKLADKATYTFEADTTLIAQWKEKPTGLLGDVNEDGEVTLVDASDIFRFKSFGIPLVNESVADVNGDGDITLVDASDVFRFKSFGVPFPTAQ